MILYLCIKVGVSDNATQVPISVEAVFKDKAKAEEFFSKSVNIWKEMIDGVSYDCTRALHEIEVDL